MNIVKRRNFQPSTSFIDDFLSSSLFDISDWSSEGSTVPKVNISETDNDFLVEMAAPGMSKKDFQVQLDNDMLTIKSEVSMQKQENEKKNHVCKEFSYRTFKRSFYLPNIVETDKIEARYKDGILSLVIPKKEEAKRKPVKTIAIT